MTQKYQFVSLHAGFIHTEKERAAIHKAQTELKVQVGEADKKQMMLQSQQLQQESQIKGLSVKASERNETPEYYTIIGYAKIIGNRSSDCDSAQKPGITAKSLSLKTGVHVRKVEVHVSRPAREYICNRNTNEKLPTKRQVAIHHG